MYEYEKALITIIEDSVKSITVRPLVLGGTSGAGGGIGGPPGGFSGYLPQTRVSYDMSELEDDSVPTVSSSLLINLNHIRYRLSQLEATSGGGASSFLDLTDAPASYTGFSGYVVSVNGTEDGLEFVEAGVGSGDVVGPAASTSGNVVLFDGTTGKLIKDGGEDLETRWEDIYRFGFITDYAGVQQTTIAFDGTNTFTLAPTSTYWQYYRNGKRITVSGSKTADLSGSPPASKDEYYIYIDDDLGTLTCSNAGWTLKDTKVPVAVVVWDNALTPKYWLSDERHTSAIDRRYHWEHHFSDGTELVISPVLSGYSVAPSSPTDGNNTFGILASEISDEDLDHVLAEIIDPDGATDTYIVFYRTAASTWTWVKKPVPFDYNVGGYIYYDDAGTKTEGANSDFYNIWMICTNISGDARFAFIMGQAEYSTLAAAQAATFQDDVDKTGFPVAEYVAVWHITFGTNSSYTTKGKCRIAAEPKRIAVSATGMSGYSGTVVSSISESGQIKLTGDVTLSEGSNITLTQSGNDISIAAADGGVGDGWTADANTWSYSSADSPTFIISINADMTTVLQAGMRIKLTQTTVKYFIITVVGAYSSGATLVTVYGGTDYTLANAAITAPYYSGIKSPFGFPMTPAKWTVQYTDTSQRQQLTPTQNVVYNLGSLSVDIPIGVWRVSYTLFMWALSNASQTQCGMHAAMSTANNSITDNDLRTITAIGGASGTLGSGTSAHCEKLLALTSKTTYYFVALTGYTNQAAIIFYNNYKSLICDCVCAYL